MDISELPFSAAQSPATSVLRRDDTSGSAADRASSALADEFDEFMLLLTTQLQNQDPTEPLDTNQFTQQLVQFTGVEQSVATNSNLERLIELTGNSTTDGAVNYIGRYVQSDGNSGLLRDSEGAFSYNLPVGTNTASITILDQAGRAVHTETVEASPGDHTYLWDGTNSFDNTDMPDGIYSFGLSVRDASGALIDAQTFTSGVVTSVNLSGTQPVLTLGGTLTVDADNIQSVAANEAESA